MQATEFARQVKTSVVDENINIYRDLYENTESPTDPYWRRALLLYKSLSVSQKEVFFEVLCQTAIDTLSNIFAVIDGVTELNGQDGDCSLTCGADKISGELHGIFLEHCEG